MAWMMWNEPAGPGVLAGTPVAIIMSCTIYLQDFRGWIIGKMMRGRLKIAVMWINSNARNIYQIQRRNIRDI